MSEEVLKDLKKVARGGGAIALSEGLTTLVSILLIITLIRSVSKNDYGLFALAFNLGEVLVVISLLGLPAGVSRQIAYYSAVGDRRHVESIIRTSLRILLLSGTVSSIALFMLAPWISLYVFDSHDLIPVLRSFCIYIPATLLLRDISGIFRGFKRVKPRAFFQTLLPRVIALTVFLVLAYLKVGVFYFSLAFVSAFAFSALMSYIYMRMNIKLSHKQMPVARSLISFSSPIMINFLLRKSIFSWMAVLMLGYFVNPSAVATFDAAQKISIKMSLLFDAMTFLFMPTAASYFARAMLPELRKTYALITKWAMLVTMPLILLLLLNPHTVLDLFYGQRYTDAWPILRILTLGILIAFIVGPVSPTMLAVGKVRHLVVLTAISAISGFALNALLIPYLGVLGAAIATMISIALYYLLAHAYIYIKYRISSITKSYLILISLSIPMCVAVNVVVSRILSGVHMLLISVPLFFLIFVFVIRITGTMEQEEKEILKAIILRILPGRRKTSIAGVVFSGAGEGRRFISMEGYRRQIERELGFSPYPGTLNVRILPSSMGSLRRLLSGSGLILKGFTKDGVKYHPVKCYGAIVRGLKCAILIPKATRHKNAVEVISPVHLRSALEIEDGDEIEIEILMALKTPRVRLFWRDRSHRPENDG